MFLAEVDSIFKTLAELLGINSAALEGGTAVVALWVAFYLVRIILVKENQDVKQVGLFQELTKLASRAVDESSLLRVTLAENTRVLQKLPEVFENMITSFVMQLEGLQGTVEHNKKILEEVTPIKDTMAEIRNDFLSARKIIVKNKKGEVILELQAQPSITESGDACLIVEYELLQGIKDETG